MTRAASGLFLAIALLAGLALATLSVVLNQLGAPALDLEHFGAERLDPRTARAMAELDGEVFATLCITRQRELPSSERDVEARALALFERLRRAAPGRFDYQVLDPESHPELEAFLARAGVAPLDLAQVRGDRIVERRAHSSLLLSYGAHGRALLRPITSERVAGLEPWIVAQLDELARPRRAVIGLAGGAPIDELAQLLSREAEVVAVDFENQARLDPRLDALWWIAPASAGAEQVAELRRFLELGRDVLIAGSPWRARKAVDRTRIEPSDFPRALLAEFGAPFGGEVILSAPPPNPSGPHDPARMLSIASDQDFRALVGQPNGTLAFEAAGRLELDLEKLALLHRVPRTLVHGGGRALRARVPSSGGSSIELAVGASPAPDEPLAVLLVSTEPHAGRLVLCASATPFVDGSLEDPELAHAGLASVLLSSFGGPEARVAHRAAPALRAALGELSARERLAWRAWVIALVPLAVLAGLWLRGTFTLGKRGSSLELAAGVVLFGLVALGGCLAKIATGLGQADLTSEQVHALSDASRELARRFLDAPTRVELIFSRPLPPDLAYLERRLDLFLGELSAAGAQLEIVRRRPEDLSEADRQRLSALNLSARAIESRDETSLTRRLTWAAAVLERPERTVGVDWTRADAAESLELAWWIACRELGSGRRPRIAFAAEAPRLSPAEARALYEEKHLFAPTAGDVFGLAREVLEHAGFEVVRVDPQAPRVPTDAELLIWMQPRRDITAMQSALVAHLARGGRAFVAGQHFVVQARQLARNALAIGDWPEPQACDLDQGWIAALGAPLVREVFFDRSMAELSIETQVERDGARVIERQTRRAPFQVLALAEGFADSPCVSGLSDQLLPAPNRWQLDAARLARLGLSARALIESSSETWSLDWKGGDLPAEVLSRASGPYLGRVPLMVELEGRFPSLELEPRVAAPRTRLVLLGSSELFKNARLFDREHRASELLIDVAATLALGEEFGRVAAQRPRQLGFPEPDAAARTRWRLAILLGPPLALLLAWLAFRRRGRIGWAT